MNKTPLYIALLFSTVATIFMMAIDASLQQTVNDLTASLKKETTLHDFWERQARTTEDTVNRYRDYWVVAATISWHGHNYTCSFMVQAKTAEEALAEYKKREPADAVIQGSVVSQASEWLDPQQVPPWRRQL